jgi:7 transmembrane receptor (rhodopsin family)
MNETHQDASLYYYQNDITWLRNGSLTTTTSTIQNSTVPVTNLSDFLAEYLGNRYHSNAEAVALTIVYCIVLITGVVGNVATCVVVASNKYLHTPTNYYLVSLAVSDALAVVLGWCELFHEDINLNNKYISKLNSLQKILCQFL